MRRCQIWVALVLWLFLLTSASLAQTEDPEALISEAFGEFTRTGDFGVAVPKFRYIAERFRGTEHGRDALRFLGEFSPTFEECQQAQRQIVADFPDTSWATDAELEILHFSFFRMSLDKNACKAGCSRLAVELGAPSLEEILSSGASDALSDRVRALGSEKQRRALKIYGYLWSVILQNHSLLIPGDRGDPETALKITKFLRKAFEPLGLGYDGIDDLEYCLGPMGAKVLGDLGPTTFSDPIVTYLSPTQGASTGPLPTIQARLQSGALPKSQISLDKLRATLDGADAKDRLRLDIAYAEVPTADPFEVITASFTPSSPLAVGQHTFTLDVPVHHYPGQGPGRTLASLTFTVTNTPPPTTTETLPANKDALVYERGPHTNEGANPRLTLEKITGKAARNLVGFDLSSVDTHALSKATLVLTIDPSQQVTGWGNGETVSVKPVTTPWQEGNGKKQGLPNSQQTTGSGAGATWFSPVDENIANDFANSVVQWNGGSTYQGQGGAAPQTVRNHQTGELRFEVTQDVKNGAVHGWLLRKDDESKGSKVSFYSREGAAGDPARAPRLLLEYGPSSARSELQQGLAAVLERAQRFSGLSRSAELRAIPVSGELSTVRDWLRARPAAAFVAEETLLAMLGPTHQPARLSARLAYRSWLRGTPSLV